MTTRAWKGGTANFNSSNAWTPAGTPVSGDTLSIISGTADARRLTLSGLTIDLGGKAAGTAPAATLLLQNSVIAYNTAVDAFNYLGLSTGTLASTTIVADGNNTNRGTIEAIGYNTPGSRYNVPATLTINVGQSVSGTLTNAGIIHSDFRDTLIVHGQAGHGQLQNDGLIESDLVVKLDIAVIGTGRIQFGAPTPLPVTPFATGQIEATSSVGAGQTVDFKAATGVDSHGALTLDDPLHFQALIRDFAASAPSMFYAHPDLIALPGVSATSLSYQSNKAGNAGTLTVDAGRKLVAKLSFAGSYTTNSFTIVAVTGGSGIELKSA